MLFVRVRLGPGSIGNNTSGFGFELLSVSVGSGRFDGLGSISLEKSEILGECPGTTENIR